MADDFTPHAEDMFGHAERGAQASTLGERFLLPPFSVLSAREGWWQDRKRAWLALGIQSELGRGATGVDTPHTGSGMADGLVALRADEKATRAGKELIPNGMGMTSKRRYELATPGGGNDAGM